MWLYILSDTGGEIRRRKTEQYKRKTKREFFWYNGGYDVGKSGFRLQKGEEDVFKA